MNNIEDAIFLDDKERSVIRIALDLYKSDIKTRLKTKDLSITARNILNKNHKVIEDLEIKFKEF